MSPKLSFPFKIPEYFVRLYNKISSMSEVSKQVKYWMRPGFRSFHSEIVAVVCDSFEERKD